MNAGRPRRMNRSVTLTAVAVSQALEQPATEILKVDRLIEDLKRVPVLALLRKMVQKAETTTGIHGHTSVTSVHHIATNPARLMRVPSFEYINGVL
jgi:hypothetical protein